MAPAAPAAYVERVAKLRTEDQCCDPLSLLSFQVFYTRLPIHNVSTMRRYWGQIETQLLVNKHFYLYGTAFAIPHRGLTLRHACLYQPKAPQHWKIRSVRGLHHHSE